MVAIPMICLRLRPLLLQYLSLRKQVPQSADSDMGSWAFM
jgi:hypothetical protein